MRKKKERIPVGTEENTGSPLSRSIGSLLGYSHSDDTDSEASLRSDVSVKKTPVAQGCLDTCIARLNQVTLHRQSAGRGGKTVTVVTLSGGAVPLDELAQVLRKGLGCGSSVEGSYIVLQGDIAGRLQDWFVKKGVKKVVLGN